MSMFSLLLFRWKRGKLEDVMQSSESAGLPVNTLGTEDSIKQGCKYFAELVTKADKLGL